MTIAETQAELAEDFEFLEEVNDKFQHIMEFGKELAPFPEEHRTEENKVRGCQSQVWLHAELKEGKVLFLGDSDALIVKGIVSILIKTFTNHTPSEILESDFTLIDDIGLSTLLSPTRTNGLASMVKQIKMYALAFQTKA